MHYVAANDDLELSQVQYLNDARASSQNPVFTQPSVVFVSDEKFHDKLFDKQEKIIQRVDDKFSDQHEVIKSIQLHMQKLEKRIKSCECKLRLAVLAQIIMLGILVGVHFVGVSVS